MSARACLAAEAFGTAALLAVVVGSGIMGESLAAGNAGVALLANAAATAAALYVLITVLGPISGAHFNPAVTIALRLRGERTPDPLAARLLAQLTGAVAGVLLTHAMFDQPLWQPGLRVHTGAAQWLSEGVATAGLVATILLGLRVAPARVPALVAAWVFAAYWFTASTAFANPAVTIARALTRSFAGIRPEDVAGFVLAQCAGAALALLALRALGAAPAQREDSR